MNKHFAEWYRTVNIEPYDEQLKHRWKGIEDYIKLDFPTSDIFELVKLFFNIPTHNEDFHTRFVNCFTNIDSAFKRNYNLEISVLAGVTLITIIEKVESMNILAIFSTLSIAFNKREAVVPDIYEKILDEYNHLSALIRENLLKYKKEDSCTPSCKNLCDHLKENGATWDSNTGTLFNNYITSLNNYVIKAEEKNEYVTKSISIYSEESQILWWLIGEWSQDLDKPFKELSSTEAALIIGKELADLVNTLPGPYSSEAVLNKMLGSCKKGARKDLIFADAIEQTSIEWRRTVVEKYPSENLKEITPVLTAITKSLEVDNEKEWLPSFKGATKLEADKIKLSSRELAFQMYVECLTIKCLNSFEG